MQVVLIFLLNSSPSISTLTTQILASLHWLPVCLKLMFSFFYCFIKFRIWFLLPYEPSRSLRSTGSGPFHLKSKLRPPVRRLFTASAPVWGAAYLKMTWGAAGNINTFESKLKTQLVPLAWKLNFCITVLVFIHILYWFICFLILFWFWDHC